MTIIQHGSITYFFVLDGPKFEIPGLLLSQSLRTQLGDAPTIIAYCSETKLADIHPVTRRALELLKVELRMFQPDQIAWAAPYPHGNKLLASVQNRDTDLSVFLDTDVVCIGPLDFSMVTADTTLFAAPEGVPTWGKNQDDWTPVYDLFGLSVPDWRVKLTKGRQRVVLPYFNAGVVGFVEGGTASGQRFPEVWLQTALEIDAVSKIPNKRPWLDQIALPVAATRMGGHVEVLPKAYNFSPYRTRDDVDLSPVRLLHYHTPEYYRKFEQSRVVTEHLLARMPMKLRRRVHRRLGPFARNIVFSQDLLPPKTT